MKKRILTVSLMSCWAALALQPAAAQQATIQEQNKVMKTYPFSDPNPVAQPTNAYYPYFRFDGFSAEGKEQSWKSVNLENDYIQLTMFPEVGGKVWGATDKTTGKAFVYDNGVVKFRDIAMRGPWVSGGIEFNFGIIGHAPSSSTPVDYWVEKKADGSVSCYVFSYELVTRTAWTVEVNLPKDKAYFTTHTTWFNQSSVDQPYYHWMNAGYRVGDNAQFCYPGNHYIGHSGELGGFPIDNDGHNIGWYESNDFGNSKSYHVLGYYNDYYGVYWHGEDFGSIHHADFDEKLGMKIFLWGLSREGGIWEDLLTDNSGQYIELQSGRVFNQPVNASGFTPYKHFSFAPQMTDEWTEYWYPVKGIQGVSKASEFGALHVTRNDGKIKLAFSPLEAGTNDVKLYADGKLVQTLSLSTKVLEPTTLEASVQVPEGHLKVVVGDNRLVYSEVKEDYELQRPMETPEAFDWNSTFGLYTQGEQLLNQKYLDQAEVKLKQALEKDAYYAPALDRLASLYYREGRYREALDVSKKALSLNTYDGDANYFYGLTNRVLGHAAEAKAAFSIASYSTSVRTAAYEQLGEMYALDQDWEKAIHYAEKSLEYNEMNLHARQLLMVAYRKTGQKTKAQEQIDLVLKKLPLYHPARFEQTCWENSNDLSKFGSLIRNELPFETYMEIAGWYENVGCLTEALSLYQCASSYPIALYRAAFLQSKMGKNEEAGKTLEVANSLSPQSVFPFRPETLKALDWAASKSDNWKIRYYEGLIYWANQQADKTKELFAQCEPTDFAPFYLSRALLKQGEERLADIQKAESIDPSWRVALALQNYYTAAGDWSKVAEVGKKYQRKYPDNYYLGLKYAKGLCETGQYASCISLLKKLQVLPNEGAYAGRAVYRDANLYQAMDKLSQKKYAEVMKSVAASKEWPENLGVGKPYDDQIDDRLENYLTAKAYAGQGKADEAKALYQKVADKVSHSKNFGTANLLSALAMREIGKEADANTLVNSWSKQFAGNKTVEWCEAIYKGDTQKASGLMKSRAEQKDSAPWENSFRDSNFDLVVRLFR